MLDLLHLEAGATVGLTLESGRLVVEPAPRRRYSLEELLAQCDPTVEISDEDRDWTGGGAVGGELL